jgi:hypothetical protein
MKINWSSFILLLLPTALRVKGIVNLTAAILAPIKAIHDSFHQYRDAITDKLKYTSQVFSLEAAIVNNFNLNVNITDSEINDLTPVNMQEDPNNAQHVILNAGDQSPFIIHPDANYTLGKYDFIVNIQQQISPQTKIQLCALIDAYKLAGKHYNIQHESLDF